MSSKTRSESRLVLERFYTGRRRTPAEEAGQTKCPAPNSMGGERHANLFCGSYPAWRTQSVLNPLSLPGHKCARCNKDYGSRVFDEEDKDEMFDFPHVLGGRGVLGCRYCFCSKIFWEGFDTLLGFCDGITVIITITTTSFKSKTATV